MKLLITNAGKVFEVESTDDPRVINQLAKAGKINPKRDTELTFYDSHDTNIYGVYEAQSFFKSVYVNGVMDSYQCRCIDDTVDIEGMIGVFNANNIKPTKKALSLIEKFFRLNQAAT